MEAESRGQQERGLRQEGQETHWQREPGALDEVEQVEIGREVVLYVTPREVIDVGFVDELTAIPGERERESVCVCERASNEESCLTGGRRSQ